MKQFIQERKAQLIYILTKVSQVNKYQLACL